MFCHYKKSTHHKKLSPGCVGIYLTCHLHFLIIFHFSYLYNLHISILVFCNFFKLNLLFLLLFLHGFSAAILNLDSTHTMNLDFSYFNLHLGFLALSKIKFQTFASNRRDYLVSKHFSLPHLLVVRSPIFLFSNLPPSAIQPPKKTICQPKRRLCSLA